MEEDMRVSPYIIRGGLSMILCNLMPEVKAVRRGEYSGTDAFVSTGKHLLIPSAFVSGQRTR